MVLMAEKLTPAAPIATPQAAPDLDAMRARESELMAERLALLEQENAQLRAKKAMRAEDPRSRAIADQMSNLDEAAPRRGVHHISEFSAAKIDYRGKAEDVQNLEAAQQD
jgi:hypothetical protein